jgi:hypothetical protein
MDVGRQTERADQCNNGGAARQNPSTGHRILPERIVVVMPSRGLRGTVVSPR